MMITPLDGYTIFALCNTAALMISLLMLLHTEQEIG